MSSDKEESSVKVCGNFEPQAWRKSICKNCFQTPEKHTGGVKPAEEHGFKVKGKENKPAVGKDKTPDRGIRALSNEKSSDKTKPLHPVGQTHGLGINKFPLGGGKDSGGKGPNTSANEESKLASATSLKDKYEQMERDKFKPKKELSPQKSTGALSNIAGKYEEMEANAKSPMDIKKAKSPVPPPVLPKQKITEALKMDKTSDRLKTYQKDDMSASSLKHKDGNFKSKFGSAENLVPSDKQKKLAVGNKYKFGSAEDINSGKLEKTHDAIKLPFSSKYANKCPDLLRNEQQKTTDNRLKTNKANKKEDSNVGGERNKTFVNIASKDKLIGKYNVEEHKNIQGKAKLDIKKNIGLSLDTSGQGKPLDANSKSERPNLTSPSVDKDKKPDYKAKFEKPLLKPHTPDSDAKVISDDKSGKSDIKRTLNEKGVKSPRIEPDMKPDYKSKFEKPSLKSHTHDLDKQVDNTSTSSKLDTNLSRSDTNLKSPMLDKDTKQDYKAKFEKPVLKSHIQDADKTLNVKVKHEEETLKTGSKTIALPIDLKESAINSKTNVQKVILTSHPTQQPVKQNRKDTSVNDNLQLTHTDKTINYTSTEGAVKTDTPVKFDKQVSKSNLSETDKGKQNSDTHQNSDVKLARNDKTIIKQNTEVSDLQHDSKSNLEKDNLQSIISTDRNAETSNDKSVKDDFKLSQISKISLDAENKSDTESKLDNNKARIQDRDMILQNADTTEIKDTSTAGRTQNVPKPGGTSLTHPLERSTDKCTISENVNTKKIPSPTSERCEVTHGKSDQKPTKLLIRDASSNSEALSDPDVIAEHSKKDIFRPSVLEQDSSQLKPQISSNIEENKPSTEINIGNAINHDTETKANATSSETKPAQCCEDNIKLPKLQSGIANHNMQLTNTLSSIDSGGTLDSIDSENVSKDVQRSELLKHDIKTGSHSQINSLETDSAIAITSKSYQHDDTVTGKKYSVEEQNIPGTKTHTDRSIKQTDPHHIKEPIKHSTNDGDSHSKQITNLPTVAGNLNDKCDTHVDTGRTDFRSKFEKPQLKSHKMEESSKRDVRRDKDKPELNSDASKKPFSYPKLKSSDGGDAKAETKMEHKATFEKPQLKASQFNKSTDSKTKFEKPESKLSKADDKKSDAKNKFQRPELKTSKVDDSGSGSKFKLSKPGLPASKTEEKKSDEKVPFWKTGIKSTHGDENAKKTDSKNKFEKPSLKSLKSDDIKTDGKNKFEIPGRKSSLQDDQKLSLKSTFEKPQLKSAKTDNKTTDVHAKFERPQLKSTQETDKKLDSSLKLDKQGVQFNKIDVKRNDVKEKYEKPQLKPLETGDKLPGNKTKFQPPELKSPKDAAAVKMSPIADKHSKLKLPPSDTKLSKSVPEETSVDPNIENELNELKATSLKHSPCIAGDIGSQDSPRIPPASSIGDVNFGNVSASNDEASAGINIDACAVSSTRGESPVHVDTQVFTSSRSKTAGDSSADDRSYLFTQPQVGFSDDHLSPDLSKPADQEGSVIKNGSGHLVATTDATETAKSIELDQHDNERLKLELQKMAEKCQQLESENSSLTQEIKKKEMDEQSLRRQKDEVETTIRDLHGQLQSMEDRCVKLESENTTLIGNIREHHEKHSTDSETENVETSLQERQEVWEEMIEENETLKEEIQELKMEMEEMYDSFRDQEAEEFRELQKELEITAKNCRILQFRMRKAERRNEQIEVERNQFEDKLTRLQNQFDNKDAVSHIRSLEVELKMAKDVSVRLHDELDMLDSKRGKVEEENRHLTDLLEQADRKQFRLELEVDKLRDQVVDLRTQMRARGDGGEQGERKPALGATGKQCSLELEVQQLKRELYDNTEREADIKDHMKFIEDDTKTLRKKVRDLEDENDNLSTQLKKISVQQAAAFKSSGSTDGGDVDSVETEIELKIQFELTEKELSVVKKKMADLEEENEMLHEDMFLLERKVKDKDQLLQIMPAPSSPNAYYEDKMKEYEKQANDFRSKLLEKEKDIEQLYGTRQGKRLRKTKSLDSDSDYNQVVDLKRQLELTQQESSVLRDKIVTLEKDNENLVNECDKLKESQENDTWQPLTALAVAYVDTENETQLREQITEMENTNSLLTEKAERLAERFISLTRKYCGADVPERFNTVPQSLDETPESAQCSEPAPANEAYDFDFGRSYVFTGTPPPGREQIVSCDVATNQQQMQINAKVLNSRDPVYILTFIDERLSLLEQLVGAMDAVVDKTVPRECDRQVSPGTNGSEIVNKISATDDKKVASTLDTGNRDLLIEKILDLEEEVDDLRLIVKTKEERAVAQEADIAEHESRVHDLQDDARIRENELLQELNILHDKNQIISHLLDIVKDRAEAAEDELNRVIVEFNEAQASQSSDDRSVNSARDGVSPLTGVSVGSDDVFDGSPTDKYRTNNVWEDQFKKRINTLERLLAEERKKAAALQKKLQIVETDTISSAMSDDVKLHMHEKELLQTELVESQKHVKIASDQIKGLTDRLKRVEADRWLSPRTARRLVNTPTVPTTEGAAQNGKDGTEQMCKSCVELQAVKDQLKDELTMFKEKSMDLEVKVDEINDIWVSKSSASESEKQKVEGMLREKIDVCKKLDDALVKLREEDRMKDIFLRERDNALKDKSNIISRKEELIHEQEEIIRQREEDLQSLLDQISQQEKHTKELTETIRVRDERLKEKDDILHNLNATIEEKTDELHYMEEEIHDTTLKRKESETLLAEMKEQLDTIQNEDKSDLETEKERLQADVDNLMTNITDLHNEKTTLQNELDKAKNALSEAMLMWDRDRSVAGADINKAREKVRMYEMTHGKKDSQAIQLLRREVHMILESKEKLGNELRLFKMDHDNTMRIMKNEKFKLTEELTSKIRMLTHEISNNDKMSDELVKLRGQDDINYQLHHHEKVLRAEHMAMKVRYETQFDRLQKEHLTLIGVVEKLQKEKNLDQEIIVGVQRSMQKIRDTYTHDLSRWRDERRVLESHIKQIDEGKEIALHLKGQIEGLKRQLSDQDMERMELVNRMTTERKGWDIVKVTYISKQNQLEEQLAMFISSQSKNKDIQYRMEVAWQKEREEHKRLLTDAHCLALDLQEQLHKRDEEFGREKKNLLDQMDRQKLTTDTEKIASDKIKLEVQTNETKLQHTELQVDELRETHKKELDFCMREKGDLLRRLADMRKIHNRDVRRIDDVLTSLKRLRELAAIVIDNDASDSGPEGATQAGDASAASASATSGGETAMADLKQNIDQIILKHIKESLRQIHFVAEDLARPVNEVSKEEKQKMRRSLSSSELELLKDELILGQPEMGKILSHHETIPQVKSQAIDRELTSVQRRITHDGTSVLDSESVPPDYVEKILTEQSSSYKDGTREKTETHVIRVSRNVSRTETKISSLPKPPPSFIIPRSRSNSPSLNVKSAKQPNIIRSIPIETSGRLSAPPGYVTSLDTSSGSTPSVNTLSLIPSHLTANSLPDSGVIHIGSLDRLSPSAARRKFFESQPSSTMAYMSWPERNRKLLQEDTERRSLSNSSELHGSADTMDRSSSMDRKRGLRSSMSVDDASLNSVHPSTSSQEQPKQKHKGMKKSQSIDSSEGKHGALRDMFAAVRRKLRPKLKRSQSARDPTITQETGPKVKHRSCTADGAEAREHVDKHVVQERMTHIQIPDETSARPSRRDEDCSKERSRSTSAKSVSSQDSVPSTSVPLTKAERIKRHFRSRSVDRVSSKDKEQHITPILVGHLSASQSSDLSWQFSETPV